MPVKKVFLTGASGYIGGDALFRLTNAYPTWDYYVLVRSSEQGEKIQKAFPNIKLVIGGLDDFEVVKNAAAAADVVVHTADSSDHATSARAISAGLRETHTASKSGYYIHISGTGILCWYDMEHKRYGEQPMEEFSYNDLEGVDALLNLPDHAFHRNVDKIVLEEAAQSEGAIKAAIVCPPTVYGIGRGAINCRSRQVPVMIDMILEEGYAPVIGAGLSENHNVHVQDLSNLIMLLASQATNIEDSGYEKEIWGSQVYYLAENGYHNWKNLAVSILEEAGRQGLVEGTGARELSCKVPQVRDDFEKLSWGLNSKGEARRARKYLGWNPTMPSLKESLPGMVRWEAERRNQ
ncbi:NAD(P)-binding protein [Aaosphaeria arxii CBS 175.79]|uniref:NAD(P)-binding protein n=1 Tax=Aaosphaeria arxii CBS 175.79 TaxID=1450172 RepID=A0A6A5XID6_9PLEO|nr:NAD(P)-binding protein [Aaosphaeria arxii CBS 175.79]KAF2012540.1 NAD(P)-binding protein [Aaosphaeria arxii CBS 175.79]